MEVLQIFGLDLAQRADTVVFMLIAVVAAGVLIITFLVGEVFDIAGDIGDIGDLDDAGAGLLNVQTVAAFLAGFGSVGWLLAGYFDVPSLVAALGGIAGGLPMAGVVVALTRMFMRQEVSTTYALEDLVGAEGVVTLGIPASGVGRVQYARAGGTHTTPARSITREAIPQGSVVVVRRIVAGELHVAPAEIAAGEAD